MNILKDIGSLIGKCIVVLFATVAAVFILVAVNLPVILILWLIASLCGVI